MELLGRRHALRPVLRGHLEDMDPNASPWTHYGTDGECAAPVETEQIAQQEEQTSLGLHSGYLRQFRLDPHLSLRPFGRCLTHLYPAAWGP